jgi:hypothetical protein
MKGARLKGQRVAVQTKNGRAVPSAQFAVEKGKGKPKAQEVLFFPFFPFAGAFVEEEFFVGPFGFGFGGGFFI